MTAIPALAPFRGTHRLLLLLAPGKQSPAYEQQMELLAGTEAERQARDLLLGWVLYEGESRVGNTVLDEADAQALRQHFGVGENEFLAVLVGKDGTAKETYRAPVAAAAVFAAIDAMPMRQQEMEGDA